MSTNTRFKTLLQRTERRTERPFWGGLLLVVAGVSIGYVPLEFTVESIMLGGRYTVIGLLVAVLVVLTGVVALVTPLVPTRRIRRRLSTIVGVTGIVLSLLSLIGTLGGLFIGLVLGFIGGFLCIDWTLFRENHR